MCWYHLANVFLIWLVIHNKMWILLYNFVPASVLRCNTHVLSGCVVQSWICGASEKELWSMPSELEKKTGNVWPMNMMVWLWKTHSFYAAMVSLRSKLWHHCGVSYDWTKCPISPTDIWLNKINSADDRESFQEQFKWKGPTGKQLHGEIWSKFA